MASQCASFGRVSGLNTTDGWYTLQAERRVLVQGVTVTFLDVALKCDLEATPWCEKPKEYAHDRSLLCTPSASMRPPARCSES